MMNVSTSSGESGDGECDSVDRSEEGIVGDEVEEVEGVCVVVAVLLLTEGAVVVEGGVGWSGGRTGAGWRRRIRRKGGIPAVGGRM